MWTDKWAMTRTLAESGMDPGLTCEEVLELLNEIDELKRVIDVMVMGMMREGK
jgi:hypothetical protein